MVHHLIEKYVRALRLRQMAENTIESAKSKMRVFTDFLDDRNIFDIKEADKQTMQDFIQHLSMLPAKNGKGYELSYKAQVLGQVRDFFQFLQKSGEIISNPALIIALPKKTKKFCHNIVSTDEIDEIEEQIDTDSDFGFRDLCMIEVLYGTGMRAAELANLKIEDVSVRERTLLIRNGKGRKDRTVPLNKHAMTILKKYIRETRKRIIRSTKSKEKMSKGFLFLGAYGGRKLNKQMISRIIEKYVDQAELDKKVTCHTLRHSCATHILQNGSDIRYIQQLLGHENLQATQIYTKVVVTDLKSTIERFHPMEGRVRAKTH